MHQIFKIDLLLELQLVDSIGGVMVSMLVTSEVDRAFEPKTIQLVIIASSLSIQH
jgi:hypothetical protein